MTSIEDQVRVYADAITAHAPARIDRAIAAVEITGPHASGAGDDASTMSSPRGRAAEGSRPRAGAKVWWAVAAAAVVLIGWIGVSSLRHQPDVRAVQTPDGKVQPVSYPTSGGGCGGSRLSDTVTLAGPASLNACIGIATTTADAKVVYVTSADGSRILGGWAVSDCPGFFSSSGSQLDPSDDNAPHLMIGIVAPDAAAQQFVLDDGTVVTAETVHVEGIDNAAFYAVTVPNRPTIRSTRTLNADGNPVTLRQQGCTPSAVTLPPEVVQPMVAALIAETSDAMGVEVGDPCPPENPNASWGDLPMSAGIAGNIHDDTCRVIGWMTKDSIPGLSGSAIYAQDGSVLVDQGSQRPTGGP